MIAKRNTAFAQIKNSSLSVNKLIKNKSALTIHVILVILNVVLIRIVHHTQNFSELYFNPIYLILIFYLRY